MDQQLTQKVQSAKQEVKIHNEDSFQIIREPKIINREKLTELERQRSRQKIKGSHQQNTSNRYYDSESEDGMKYQQDQVEEDVLNPIRQAFIDFFQEVKHKKGLVFNQNDRKELNKIAEKVAKKRKTPKIIKWKEEAQWDYKEQIQKINQALSDPKIQISNDKKSKLKNIFLHLSYMFANEVTAELYLMLKQIFKIGLSGKNQEQTGLQIQDFMKKAIISFSYFNFAFLKKGIEHPESTKLQIFKNLGTKIYKQFQKIIK